jgi:hypothetical protein
VTREESCDAWHKKQLAVDYKNMFVEEIVGLGTEGWSGIKRDKIGCLTISSDEMVRSQRDMKSDM